MQNRYIPKCLYKRPIAAALLTALAASLVTAADYQSLILGDHPLAYYRLNDSVNRAPVNVNTGTLGAAGNATNDLPPGVVHPFPGALAGDGNRSEFFDFTTRTEIPWTAALNTPNTQPFTVEAWFYPASDQTGNGQAPMANRYAWSGENRQGWVFFQRRPNADYVGSEAVGWNFRMYNGIGTSGRLDVTSLVPYEVGKWQHVVVVYDPVQVTNATVTMYIDGVAANTNIWSGTDPGYVANSNDHVGFDPANLAIGNYNNTAGTTLNPYFGAVDEFAWYSNKLSPAQILAHYQNGTNANRSTPYDVLIKSQNPVAYLRLDEIAPGPNTAVNLGDVRNTGIGTNTAEVNHPAATALNGRTKDGSGGYHLRNGSSTTSMPFLAANNPDASVPFTFETWLRPTSDRQNPGAAAVNNRYQSSGNRTGWVIFQRAPNDTYTGLPGFEGVGWNFRMYTGSGTGGQNVTTALPYNVGEWQHFVVTWEPQTDVGPAANGGIAWQGILTAYINGIPVATNISATYSANTDPTEDATAPSDLAVGSYNAASGFGANPYEGDVDELAIYRGYVLTADQVLSHYVSGTSAPSSTNYETLVLTAGFTGPERVGLPSTYLRFNDPAYYPAANIGSLGYLAGANEILTTNIAAGPQPPAYSGFEASNTALPLNGAKQWASLNNPSGLNISGQITLEAWIQPAATQANDPANILAHGAPTYSEYLSTAPPPTDFGAPTNGNQVFLRVEGPGPFNYTVGSSTFTNGLGTSYNYVSVPAPAGDFGGSSWVHLAGIYDGSNWRLYRNGVQVGVSPNVVGALPVSNGDWAIGATGEGWAANFAGVVDEPAVYNTALSASQIAKHYSMGVLGPSPLTINHSGANVVVTWPVGTLQSATVVTGPYTDVVATSPYTTPASGAQRYFRIRL